jgi:hypothetical protein
MKLKKMENASTYIFQSSIKWQFEEMGNEGKMSTKLRQKGLKVKFFLTDQSLYLIRN